MQFKQDGNTFIIYIEQNEPIMETLTQFCKSKDIVNAQKDFISKKYTGKLVLIP